MAKKPEKPGFLALFWRSAVTLHQELDGIPRLPAASQGSLEAKSRRRSLS